MTDFTSLHLHLLGSSALKIGRPSLRRINSATEGDGSRLRVSPAAVALFLAHIVVALSAPLRNIAASLPVKAAAVALKATLSFLSCRNACVKWRGGLGGSCFDVLLVGRRRLSQR